jgi:uncharacterized cupredoxin-like copper-binding protein
MPRLRACLVTLVIAAVSAACGSASSLPSSPPNPTAASPFLPSAAPTVAQSASAAPGSSSAVTVALSEWKVAVGATLKAGTTDFAIANQGAAPHELLVFKSDLEPNAYPTDASGDIQEDGPGVTLLSDGENIQPGGTQARTVDLTPGKYLFVCNIPGHFKQGMFTVVTVTP